MTAYYNEHDPYAAEWLRNLIKAGHIARGDVDERSIEDVRPSEIRGYTQCHFFAGIGVWSYALRRAGWPDSRPVWTGSCPCQPFSEAGKGAGFADERHLWPAWNHLIVQCRPERIYGEQVASKDGLAWLDLILSDLENAGYAFGAADICAAGVGAPHIRQRIFFVANADGQRQHPAPSEEFHDSEHHSQPFGHSGSLEHPGGERVGRRGRCDGNSPRVDGALQVAGRRSSGGVADTSRSGRREECAHGRGLAFGDRAQGLTAGLEHGGSDHRPGPTNGHWRDADWLFCRDGRWRPVEPSTFPLVNGAASRVGRLRAYGNAIVAQVAEEFIRATI